MWPVLFSPMHLNICPRYICVLKLFPFANIEVSCVSPSPNPGQIWCKSIFLQRTFLPLLSFKHYQVPANMATSRKIVLAPEDHGVFYFKSLTMDSAVKASEVLQGNHDKFHITYNADGFHSEYQFGERCPRFLLFLSHILA